MSAPPATVKMHRLRKVDVAFTFDPDNIHVSRVVIFTGKSVLNLELEKRENKTYSGGDPRPIIVSRPTSPVEESTRKSVSEFEQWTNKNQNKNQKDNR
jgi:hypothetical protein